jgi:hypothetical protein
MPISREQFEQGLDDTAQKILKFLAEHPDNAYEPSEIVEVTHQARLPSEDSLWRGIALLSLTWQNHGILEELVDKKIIKGVSWYTLHKG